MLTVLAWVSISVALLCATVIAADEVRHPQKMGIMNVVWPVTALYFSVFAVWAYFTWANRSEGRAHRTEASGRGNREASVGEPSAPPTARQIAIGTSHCGAGCTIADLGTEFAIGMYGPLLFGSMLLTDYFLDFLVAWTLGIVFQYFAIRPMRQDLRTWEAVWAAIKADTLSITAFQIGMYLWMALVRFKLFPAPHQLTPFDPRYWLMMQIAMICGFATSYPMNQWLVKRGIKEAM